MAVWGWWLGCGCSRVALVRGVMVVMEGEKKWGAVRLLWLRRKLGERCS